MISLFGSGYRPLFKKVDKSPEQNSLQRRAREYADKVCHAEPSESKREWFALHLRLFKESEDARVEEPKAEVAAAS